MLRWGGVVLALVVIVIGAAMFSFNLRHFGSEKVVLPDSANVFPPPPVDVEPSAAPTKLAPTASEARRTFETEATPTFCLDLGVAGACVDKDKVLAGLKTAPYAFNAIEEMRVGRHYGMSLVIDPSRSADLKNALASSQGRFVEGTTKIALRMEAELSGPTFTIEPKGRIERELSKLNPTRWDWEVTPASAGSWPLQLSMYVILLGADGKKISEDNPLVERRTIAVTVTWTDRVLNIVKTVQPIWGFAAVVISAVVGAITWIGARRWKGRKPPDTPPSGKSGTVDRKKKQQAAKRPS